MITTGWLTKQQQFFKLLVGNFEKKLWIPTDFVKHISKEESSGIAILNGPSGNCWFILLTITARGLYFKDGWATFLRDNSLKFGDDLVFTYIGDMHFHVMFFRNQSAQKGEAGVSDFSFTSHLPHFVCEMKAYSVQKYFVLTVPAKFAKAYLPTKQTTIVLQNDEGNTWDVILTVQGLQLQHHALVAGWKAFSKANDLKLGDCCVFELAEVSKMIVHIYRR